MGVRRSLWTTVWLGVAMLLVVSPAAAQRAAGPYSDLLGATPETPTRHTLDVRASLYGAWDDILSSTDESALDDQFLRSGFAGGATGALVHARRSSRLQWNSSATTSLRMYGKEGDVIAATFSGTTGIDTRLSRRLRLVASGGFAYSPYYNFSPTLDDRFIPTGAINGGYGVATAAQRNTTTDGDVRVDVALSRRDTLNIGANARKYEFLDQSASSITSYGWHGIFRHALARGVGLHGGFTRQAGLYQYTDSTDVTNDTIDIGVDYGDTLKFSRRTAFSFSASTSAVHWGGDTHYRIDGNAGLTRSFGRSGSMALRYVRDTNFEPGFREPLLSNMVTGSISNQLGLRTTWSVSVGHTRGRIGFDPGSDGGYSTTNAGGRITRGLGRHLAVFGDYSYYRYDVPSGATVFTALSKFSRQSVSGGLTVWLPLVNDRRTVTP
jgi:hypothetical protein